MGGGEVCVILLHDGYRSSVVDAHSLLVHEVPVQEVNSEKREHDSCSVKVAAIFLI